MGTVRGGRACCAWITAGMALLGACAAQAQPSEEAAVRKPVQQGGNAVPRARDPQIAVEEEFARAAALNTSAGWRLFIERHPDNALTPKAHEALKECLKSQKD